MYMKKKWYSENCINAQIIFNGLHIHGTPRL